VVNEPKAPENQREVQKLRELEPCFKMAMVERSEPRPWRLGNRWARDAAITASLRPYMVDDTVTLVCQYARQPQVVMFHSYPDRGHRSLTLYDPSLDEWSHEAVPSCDDNGYCLEGAVVLGPVVHASCAMMRHTEDEFTEQVSTNTITGHVTILPGCPSKLPVQLATLGRVLFALGDVGWGTEEVENKLYSLDLDAPSPTWMERASATRGGMGRSHVAALTLGDRLYAIGGFLDQSVACYDALTDTWSPRASMAVSRWESATAVGDNMIYVCGGRSKDPLAVDKCIPSCEAYDPVTDKWRCLAPMQQPHACGRGVFVDGHVLVCGGVMCLDAYGYGCEYKTRKWSHWVERYNPRTNTWQQMAPLPMPILRSAVVL
jgi:hypothetical protein